MDINKILKSDYLDILFEGRNKSYGSYDLRRTYPERMKKSGVVILSICLIGFGYNIFANRAKKINTAAPAKIEVQLSAPPPIDEKAPPPPPPPSEPPPPVKPTVQFTPPEIKKDEEVKEDKQMVDNDEMKDKAAGLTTQAGDEHGIDPGIIDNPGTGNGVVEAVAEPTIYKIVEQMPEFVGGDDALQKYLLANTNYPERAAQAQQQGTVRVRFVVNEDGSVSNIEVTRPLGFGMDEEAKRVVAKMPKWKAGQNNGRAVKVYCTLPIRFVVQ